MVPFRQLWPIKFLPQYWTLKAVSNKKKKEKKTERSEEALVVGWQEEKKTWLYFLALACSHYCVEVFLSLLYFSFLCRVHGTQTQRPLTCVPFLNNFRVDPTQIRGGSTVDNFRGTTSIQVYFVNRGIRQNVFFFSLLPSSFFCIVFIFLFCVPSCKYIGGRTYNLCIFEAILNGLIYWKCRQ